MDDTRSLAKQMVKTQLVSRGIHSEAVLSAMETVPRHLFVAPDMIPFAYEDRALPLMDGQTISQPYMVAVMTELLHLKPADRVLEIGTGSGYQAAVLSLLCREVHTVERIPSLHARAGHILATHGYANVHVHLSDGTLGLPDAAPFDAIIVTAAAPSVPPPLLEQLADGGRLVAPVGDRYMQDLVLVIRQGARFERTFSTPCVFVPLIGEHGFSP